jgi:hypothetical protein
MKYSIAIEIAANGGFNEVIKKPKWLESSGKSDAAKKKI